MTFFYPKSNSSKYDPENGFPTTAHESGRFGMPTKDVNALMQATGGDILELEKALGVTPAGLWANDEIGLIKVNIPSNVLKENNLRMATGNELGAYEGEWKAGGWTDSQLPQREAIIDPLNWDDIADNWIDEL